jgi:hypothetical protein
MTFAKNPMATYKPITDHEKAAQRFLSDLDGNGIITYNISDFAADIVPSVYPTSYLSKCTHATVALSGCAPDQHDYMVICPYRVDRDRGNQQMVYDIDPTIITLDSISLEPSPVAVIGYHQSFLNRTSPITGFAYTDIYTTVNALKQTIYTTGQALSCIPQPVENGLHHMADYFRKHYGLK